jgi:hypothetical protein
MTAVMSAVSIAATTATTIAQASAQHSAQQHQAEAQDQANAVQRQYIDQDRISKITQAQGAEALVNTEAAQKLDQNAQQARAATSTANTAAGEAGVTGNSVAALQQEYMSRAGSFSDQVEQNRSASVDRLQLQMSGFNVDANAANARLPVPNYPSGMDTALRIGGALANGAAKGVDWYTKLPTSDTSSYTGNGLSISSGTRRAEQNSYD